MPLAVAVLCHPIGAYACLVTALAAFAYACHTRTFVPAFTCVSAAALATLAFLQVPPHATGLFLVVVAVALLQCEFLVPTYGTAFVIGIATAGGGSWLLLTDALPSWPRAAVAGLGTALLLAAVLRGVRLRTLPVP